MTDIFDEPTDAGENTDTVRTMTASKTLLNALADGDTDEDYLSLLLAEVRIEGETTEFHDTDSSGAWFIAKATR